MNKAAFGAALALLLSAAAIPGEPPPDPGTGPASPEAPQFVIRDFMFAPGTLTVKAGTRVVWVNQDEEPHNVVSDAGLFRSAGLDTNEIFSYVFEKPGTYRFWCSIHPRMLGTVIVQ